MSYVYVIGTSDGPKKIGIAANPIKRLHQIRCASPVHIDILFSADVGEARPRSVEATVHEALASRHLRGEWFDVSLEAAKAAITAAIAGTPPEPELTGGGILPVQCRMARKMVGCTQADLARDARTSDRTVLAFERGEEIARPTQLAIRKVLECQGARFLERDGEIGVMIPWALADDE